MPEPHSHARARANYFRGTPPRAGAGDLVTIRSPSGVRFTVHRQAAPAFQGFLNEVESRGYSLRQGGDTGGYNRRTIAGSSRWSQHAYGNALDINQVGRDIVVGDYPEWIDDVARQFGIIPGTEFGDKGHFEWGGVPLSESGGAGRYVEGSLPPYQGTNIPVEARHLPLADLPDDAFFSHPSYDESIPGAVGSERNEPTLQEILDGTYASQFGGWQEPGLPDIQPDSTDSAFFSFEPDPITYANAPREEFGPETSGAYDQYNPTPAEEFNTSGLHTYDEEAYVAAPRETFDTSGLHTYSTSQGFHPTAWFDQYLQFPLGSPYDVNPVSQGRVLIGEHDAGVNAGDVTASTDLSGGHWESRPEGDVFVEDSHGSARVNETETSVNNRSSSEQPLIGVGTSTDMNARLGTPRNPLFGMGANSGQRYFNAGSGWQPIGSAPQHIRGAWNSGTGNFVADQTSNAMMPSWHDGGIGIRISSNTGDEGHNVFTTGQGSRTVGRMVDGVLMHVPTTFSNSMEWEQAPQGAIQHGLGTVGGMEALNEFYRQNYTPEQQAWIDAQQFARNIPEE